MKTLDLHIGTKVHSTDQECGSLAHIVVNPETQKATGIVVERGMLFMKGNHVLPVELVKDASEAAIHLNVHSSEIEKYPEYQEVVVKEPDSTMQAGSVMSPAGYAEYSVPMIRRRLRRGIPSEMAVVGSNTPVETAGETVGHVDHVLIDKETRVVTHMVMRTGLLFHDYRVVPTEMIEAVNDHVYLKASPEELETLPRYEERDEAEVLADVQKRLAAEPETYGAVRATMEDRTLKLFGIVRSQTIKYHTEQLARSVNGVIDVENNLVVDPELQPERPTQTADAATQIQTALASDKRTADVVIEVINDGGIIVLQGVVDDLKTRKAAEEIASQQPGVISVFNELVVLR